MKTLEVWVVTEHRDKTLIPRTRLTSLVEVDDDVDVREAAFDHLSYGDNWEFYPWDVIDWGFEEVETTNVRGQG